MPAARPRLANRLALEKSPYLRQHAHNPVDWHPWGDEAFAEARAAQKPIFLSIGYSTCHWCHVMAHESFENESIARLLNRDFVPVKVDREERPDVDRVYMTYVQAATGQGGWPMSVWLTPDLEPFYGGTYFPPEDRWGRRGFAALLDLIAQAWANDREKLLAEGLRVTAALRESSGGQGSKLHAPSIRTQDPEPGDAVLAASVGGAFETCFQQLAGMYDAEWGGFGGAPKFPRAAVFNFLFRAAAGRGRIPNRDDADELAQAAGPGGRPSSGSAADPALQMAAHTLRRMAEGGIHDHVGGGFHRYSVDDEWFVPHFEKMLYDQAQLAVSYLEARQATGDERYAWIARDIFDYVLRDLANPEGGFCSAEDADSPFVADDKAGVPASEGATRQAEGAFYLWTRDEIGRALDEVGGGDAGETGAAGTLRRSGDAELLSVHFGVRAAGNVTEARDPQGEFRSRNILRQRQPLAQTAQQFGLEPDIASERLAAGLAQLRAVRARRPRPQRDDKILTAWNGLMISALAKGHEVLEAIDGRGGPPDFDEAVSRPIPDEGPRRSSQSVGGPGRPSDPALPVVAPFLAAAVGAAEFIRRGLYDESAGVLYRCYREGRSDIQGFAEDYAYLIQGLLDLYEAAFDIRWLQWAVRLQAKMDESFWDADGGGYFNSRAADPSIIARLKEDYDGAEPAPSSVAVLNLLRLDAMLGDTGSDSRAPSHRARAARCLEAFRSQWSGEPHRLPQMLCALELIRMPPRTVVLAGHPGADDFRRLADVTHERAGPRWTVLAADQGEGQAWLAAYRPALADMRPIGGRATAYVCENWVCREPTTAPEVLRRLLQPTLPPPP